MQNPQPILPTAIYTLKEACELLRISEATARRWIRASVLPTRRAGRDYRFLGTDLLSVLDPPPPPGHPTSGGFAKRRPAVSDCDTR